MEKQKPTVKLTGEDGNAFYILGAVSKELERNGYTQSEIDEYYEKATSGDYDHLLQVTMEWVEVV